MLLFFIIMGCIGLCCFLIFLYALCKVSFDADRQAGYMEEDTKDIEEIEEEE